jgi:AcrR family transcriptional regulator
MMTRMSALTLADDRPDAPDVELRTAVIDASIELFRTHAFNEVSFSMIAAVAGVIEDEVVRCYPTMNDLVVETVEIWNGRRMVPMLSVAEQFGAVAFLRRIVIANQGDPALMRLLSAIVNIAATPGHPVAHILQRQWVQFHAHVQRTLAHDIEVGREPDTMNPASGAEQLIAMYEGLQLQSMLRPHMNVLDSYDRAVTRLRNGWSTSYSPPTWDI